MPLSELVFAAMSGHVKNVQGGSKVLVSVQAQGVSSEYQVPVSGISSEALAEVCAELINLIEEIKAGAPDMTDDALTAELIVCLRPVTSLASNFGGLRL